MTFQEPLWLVVSVAVLALGTLGLRRAETRRRHDLARFVSGPLLTALTATSSARRRLAKGALVLGALALCCVALARPTLGHRQEKLQHRGADVLFAVDVSRSMLADDVKPDRLTRAKLAVMDLLEKLPQDRVGLVAFAGSAFLQSPLTVDHGAFRETLESLDTDVIPRGGTDLGAALHAAEDAFRTAGREQKILVLLTDGEDLAGNARVAADEAAKQGIMVYTVGVGTAAGERIPLSQTGATGVVVDERGEPVTSRLDEDALRAVAEATGGFYVPLGAHGEGLETLYQRVLADAPKQELASRLHRTPIERFQWPLAVALALVIGEALLGDRRRSAARDSRTAPALVSVVPALLLLLVAAAASASPRDAEKAYAAGAYDKAATAYRAAADAKPGDARLRFNEGAAAYRAGKHEDAAAAFTKALEGADVALQQRAYYDLGNARFRLGEAAAKESPEKARAGFEASIQAYDGALALDPKDENANFNRELARARLAALEQEQQQQEQQQEQEQQEQDEQEKQPQDEPQQQQGKQQGEEPGQQSPPQGESKQPGQSPEASPSEQPGAPPQEAKPQPGEGAAPQESQPPKEAAAPAPKDATPESSKGEPRDTASAPAPEEPQAPESGPAAKPEGKAERADGQEAPGPAPTGSTTHEPGQMSVEDAARLLDSLRGDELRAPRARAQQGGAGSEDDEPIRDW